MGEWTFFSNYGHVLVCLERNNRARLRDVAEAVGITERAVQKIVKDLEQAGYITIRKQGRCNRYRINRRKSLRHGLESHVTVSRLLALVAPAGRATTVVEAKEVETAVDEADDEPVSGMDAAQPIQPVADAEPEPEPEPKPELEEEKSSSTEGKKGTEPLDVEQQGSLF